MPVFKPYASYSFIDKDPVIDRLRTVVQDSGVEYAKLSSDSGVSTRTLWNWFEGQTKRPSHAAIAAAFAALGYDLLPMKRGESRQIVPLRAGVKRKQA